MDGWMDGWMDTIMPISYPNYPYLLFNQIFMNLRAVKYQPFCSSNYIILQSLQTASLGFEGCFANSLPEWVYFIQKCTLLVEKEKFEMAMINFNCTIFQEGNKNGRHKNWFRESEQQPDQETQAKQPAEICHLQDSAL